MVALLNSCASQSAIFPLEQKAPSANNTGDVRISMPKKSGETMIVHFLFEKGSRNFWHYHRMTVTEHSVKDHVIQLHAVSDEEYASSTLNKQDTLTILHPEYKKESKNINIAQNEVKCD